MADRDVDMDVDEYVARGRAEGCRGANASAAGYVCDNTTDRTNADRGRTRPFRRIRTPRLIFGSPVAMAVYVDGFQ
jgi:hypothetical protein